SSSALLALRLGARHRRQRLLRQYRLGAVAQGGPSSYELRVGVALHRALAEGAGADGGRQRRAAHSGNAAGWGHCSLNAKGNLYRGLSWSSRRLVTRRGRSTVRLGGE